LSMTSSGSSPPAPLSFHPDLDEEAAIRVHRLPSPVEVAAIVSEAWSYPESLISCEDPGIVLELLALTRGKWVEQFAGTFEPGSPRARGRRRSGARLEGDRGADGQ
jgi:hypothetical protein